MPRGEAGVLSLRRASEGIRGIRRQHLCFVTEDMEDPQSGSVSCHPVMGAWESCALCDAPHCCPQVGPEKLPQRQQGRA